MIESDAYLHFENKKLKKTDKIDTYFKKIILINYRDHSIYCLYNKKINLIFVSCSVDINENSMLKKITTVKIFKIESLIIEFAEFAESFTDFFSQNDESIIKNMTLSVRAKDKKKMFSSSS